jgi:hypothetical protein
LLGLFFFLLLILLFHVTCPGNGLRTISETATWYPEYSTFTILDKLVLGATTTICALLINNIIMIFFFLLLTIIVVINQKRKLDIMISFLLLISIIIFSFSPLAEKIPFINIVYQNSQIWSSPVVLVNINYSAWIVISYGILVILLMFYLFINYMRKNIFWITIIFLAGILSKVMIGFSPTVFASGNRTAIFLNYFTVLIILHMISYIYDSSNWRVYNPNLKICYLNQKDKSTFSSNSKY